MVGADVEDDVRRLRIGKRLLEFLDLLGAGRVPARRGPIGEDRDELGQAFGLLDVGLDLAEKLIRDRDGGRDGLAAAVRLVESVRSCFRASELSIHRAARSSVSTTATGDLSGSVSSSSSARALASSKRVFSLAV